MLCSFTCLSMTLCVFNPEHDLCLAKGRWNYVPPQSAVEFARRDADIMRVLYPDAVCTSVYDFHFWLHKVADHSSLFTFHFDEVVAWGWDAVVKHELVKRGVPEELLPSDEEIATIRELQHRSTILPLQPDCNAVGSVAEIEALLQEREHWVMKAPWSGAGRGLRWVHGRLTDIDRDWLQKTVSKQRCVIAEPRREVVADLALEYMLEGCNGRVLPTSHYPLPTFIGYSYFRTGSGVYKENILWTDEQIESTFPVREARERIEPWLAANVWPRYRGPLGVDLMVCADGSVHVAEINFRHTMGMMAHEKVGGRSSELGVKKLEVSNLHLAISI